MTVRDDSDQDQEIAEEMKCGFWGHFDLKYARIDITFVFSFSWIPTEELKSLF